MVVKHRDSIKRYLLHDIYYQELEKREVPKLSRIQREEARLDAACPFWVIIISVSKVLSIQKEL